MPITESRLKAGKLTLGGASIGLTTGEGVVDFSCQPSNVEVRPGTQEGSGADGDDIEVLCGDVSSAGGSADSLVATLAATALQDFTDADGLQSYSWQNNGAERFFTWNPNGNADNLWSGKVRVKPITVGGDVNKRLTTEFEWDITLLKLPTAFGGAYVIGSAPA